MPVVDAAEDTLPGSRGVSGDTTELRQLRHHTKNSLQRLIAQLSEASFQCECREERLFVEGLVRQIKLSAAISDALFGLTHMPEPFPERLRSLVESLRTFYTDGAQTVRLEIVIPPGLTMSQNREDLILRLIHELAVNAFKHGMHMRLVGKISILISRRVDGGLFLSVINDGWKISEQASPGEGLGIVRELVCAEGGDMKFTMQPHTNFQIILPPERGRYAAGPA